MIFVFLYFAIGLLTAISFIAYWFTCKGKVEKPVTLNVMLQRALLYGMLWPLICWIIISDPDISHFLTTTESESKSFEWPTLNDAYFEERDRQ